jgi:hypothetical protein
MQTLSPSLSHTLCPPHFFFFFYRKRENEAGSIYVDKEKDKVINLLALLVKRQELTLKCPL